MLVLALKSCLHQTKCAVKMFCHHTELCEFKKLLFHVEVPYGICLDSNVMFWQEMSYTIYAIFCDLKTL